MRFPISGGVTFWDQKKSKDIKMKLQINNITKEFQAEDTKGVNM
jgi:hypothetical protein